MVAPKVSDSKKQMVSYELPATEIPAKTSPKVTKPKPLDVERKPTDFFWLLVFCVLFIAWLGLIGYVVSTREMYKHEINANQTHSDIAESDDAAVDNWWIVLKKGFTAFFEILWKGLKEQWHNILLLIVGIFAAGIFVIWACRKVRKSTAHFCMHLLMRILLFCILILIFVDPHALPSSTDVGEERSIEERIHPYDMLNLCSYAQSLWMVFLLSIAKDLGYFLNNAEKMAPYRRGSLKFKLLVILTILFFVALTIAAVQFTSPLDPLRYVILAGGYYVIKFMLTFANMVDAQAVATYHRSAKDDADKEKCSVFHYAKIIIRYHLGTAAFSTLDILAIPQSLFVTLRHGFVPIAKHGNVIYSLLQKVHIVFNAADYAEILTAINGSDHYESTKASIVLLSKNCAMSSVAMFKGLDTILNCGLVALIYVKVLKPLSEFGFEFLPIPKTLHTDDLSIWILIGIFVGVGYTFYCLGIDSIFVKTSRMCLLEDKVRGGKRVRWVATELVMCFDIWCVEDDAKWYSKSAELKEVVTACNKSKIEKVDESNSESVPSIVEGKNVELKEFVTACNESKIEKVAKNNLESMRSIVDGKMEISD